MSSRNRRNWETAGRVSKVLKLIRAANARHYTAEQVANNLEVRLRLVDDAGVREPSTATWAALVDYLAKAESQAPPGINYTVGEQ